MAFDPRLNRRPGPALAGSCRERHGPAPRPRAEFKGVLQSQLAQLDLVTREEFDVQATD